MRPVEENAAHKDFPGIGSELSEDAIEKVGFLAAE
jgi:hypothetical protein